MKFVVSDTDVVIPIGLKLSPCRYKLEPLSSLSNSYKLNTIIEGKYRPKNLKHRRN